MLDSQFEEILRRYLPHLRANQPLKPDMRLRDVGLDSLAMVELLSAVEKEYDIRLDDRAMTMETFETPATLWRAVDAARR
ncbi:MULTISPECIES: acyl carrier protein [Streptomyces]|uniref:Acyl carrier protein n=1 Tax=Streptomyces fimbriatus TaxID=68197 RepID=A0ABW0D667_STRFI|nr:acyl carrier protein [Streptomyces sp.]